MEIINLTPHAINIYSGNTIVATIVPSGVVARVSETFVKTDDLDITGTPCSVEFGYKSYGNVEGLPEYQSGSRKFYFVSSLVAAACPGRTDLVTPGNAVRNEKGQIIGLTAFCFNK